MKQSLAVLVGAALLMSACGRMSSPDPALAPNDAAAVARLSQRDGTSATGTSAAPATAPQESVSTATLNTKLLRQASTTESPGDLPLGPGDLIEITVFEVPELSGLKLRISRPGVVVMPLLGEVPAAGKTPGELETDLRQRLTKSYMYDPHVTVFVHERTSQRVSVIGAVRKGGVIELTGRLRLADALGKAEGLTDDADHVVYLLRRVPAGTIARAQGSAQATTTSAGSPPAAGGDSGGTEEVMTAINLDAMAKGSDDMNVLLEAGDVIQVPRAGSIYVGGSVTKPGSLPLKSNTTVHQAILAAGGATNVAALADVRLYRTKANGQIEVITLDLNDFEAGKGSPDLEKNDVVIVGKSPAKAFFWTVYELFRGMFGVGVGL